MTGQVTSYRAARQLLVGRRIVRVRLNPFADGRGGWAYQPAIYLDNGTVVSFMTDETEIGEYGTQLLYATKEEE